MAWSTEWCKLYRQTPALATIRLMQPRRVFHFSPTTTIGLQVVIGPKVNPERAFLAKGQSYSAMPQVDPSCYDYPRYYDLAFRSETRAEVAFIEAVCRKYCPFPVRRMLEPGCGGGRLVVALAGRGYDMVGFDLNQPSLNYLLRRMKRRKLRAQAFRADMAEFRLTQPVDAAFTAWDTFRHLTSERAARRHLECVAASLRRGGIYILGFHLLPLDVPEQRREHWSAQHGSTKVTVTLDIVATDRRRRIEEIRLVMQVHTRSRDLRLHTQFPFRIYTASQFRALLASVPQFELCDVYDFHYDINHPLQLNDEITDTVCVLRRR